MIERSYDPKLIDEIVDTMTEGRMKIDPEGWVSNKDNIMLVDHDDVAVFEHSNPGTVNGHYYFTSRGKKAISVAHTFLDEIFNECYNIQVVKGFIPLKNLGARWISRQLGFKSQGIVKVEDRNYEFFILTKKEFMNG